MSDIKRVVVTESGYREQAHEAVNRLLPKLEVKLKQAVMRLDTGDYLNGELTIWVEAKVHYEPPEEPYPYDD